MADRLFYQKSYQVKDTKSPINNANIKPAHVAQKCPVCNGWGTVSYKRISCHACSGKGFILVPLDKHYGKPR